MISEGYTFLKELLDPGNVVNAVNFPSLPTFDLNVTISFVKIPLVGMSVSLTKGGVSLGKMMEPFGSLMRTVTSLGFLDNDNA